MKKVAKSFMQGSSFLFGFLLALDFTGQIGRREIERCCSPSYGNETDAERIARDWLAVGNDMRNAMKKVRLS